MTVCINGRNGNELWYLMSLLVCTSRIWAKVLKRILGKFWRSLRFQLFFHIENCRGPQICAFSLGAVPIWANRTAKPCCRVSQFTCVGEEESCRHHPYPLIPVAANFCWLCLIALPTTCNLFPRFLSAHLFCSFSRTLKLPLSRVRERKISHPQFGLSFTFP